MHVDDACLGVGGLAGNAGWEGLRTVRMRDHRFSSAEKSEGLLRFWVRVHWQE